MQFSLVRSPLVNIALKKKPEGKFAFRAIAFRRESKNPTNPPAWDEDMNPWDYLSSLERLFLSMPDEDDYVFVDDDRNDFDKDVDTDEGTDDGKEECKEKGKDEDNDNDNCNDDDDFEDDNEDDDEDVVTSRPNGMLPTAPLANDHQTQTTVLITFATLFQTPDFVSGTDGISGHLRSLIVLTCVTGNPAYGWTTVFSLIVKFCTVWSV